MESPEFYFFIEPRSQEYQEIVEIVKIVENSRFEHPKLDISQGFSIELLFAAINIFYFKFFFHRQNNLLVKSPPNPLSLFLENFSRSLKNFKALERLSCNFDRRSANFSLSSSIKSNKSPALLKLNIFALTYMNRRNESEYVKLFYSPEGFLHDSLENSFKSSSLICGLPSARLSRLMFLIENYEYLETTRVFKCSSDCDFIYFISDCGLTEEESICPYCKKLIGGLNSKAHRLEEQIILSKEQAFVVLSKLIQKYNQKQNTGIHVLKAGHLFNQDFFSVDEIGFHFLNVFIKANLLALIELRLYEPRINSSFFIFDEDEFSQDEVADIKRDYYKKFLHGNIDKHLVKIKEILSNFYVIFVFACIQFTFFHFFQFLQETSGMMTGESREEVDFKRLEFGRKLSEFVIRTIEIWKNIENNGSDSLVELDDNLQMKKYSVLDLLNN